MAKLCFCNHPTVFRTVIIKNRINNYSSKLINLEVNKEEKYDVVVMPVEKPPS